MGSSLATRSRFMSPATAVRASGHDRKVEQGMTNDQLVNGMPADWTRLREGEYSVRITRGSRGNAEEHLYVGQRAVFTYCDTDAEGVIKEIEVVDP